MQVTFPVSFKLGFWGSWFLIKSKVLHEHGVLAKIHLSIHIWLSLVSYFGFLDSIIHALVSLNCLLNFDESRAFYE